MQGVQYSSNAPTDNVGKKSCLAIISLQ